MKRERPAAARRERGESGSVLMEAVLVLPIYLMILGSMFILGDLARGRIKLMEIERFTTWIGVDRWAAHAPARILARLGAFVETKTAPLNTIFLEKVREGSRLFGNHWMDAVRGYGVLDVQVPYWMGMANAEQVVWHPEEGQDMTFRGHYLLPGRTDGKGIRYPRSFVFRRLPEESGEAYRRNRRDTLGIINETVWNVLNDNWSEPDTHEAKTGYAPVGWEEYVRLNDMIAYGE